MVSEIQTHGGCSHTYISSFSEWFSLSPSASCAAATSDMLAWWNLWRTQEDNITLIESCDVTSSKRTRKGMIRSSLHDFHNIGHK